MSDTVFYFQPGYLLHQQNYRETSLILDVLTKDLGRISLLAKGVRKPKSKTAGILRPFIPLSLSFVGKTTLKTLTQVEVIDKAFELKGMALYCGFYVNELVSSFLHKEDPYPEVFYDYQDCITQLAQSDLYGPALRKFELNLMDNIGYGVLLGMDLRHERAIDSSKKYLFNKDEGLVEAVDGLFSGSTLLAMEQRDFADPAVLNEAKNLMRLVIDSRLQGKRLKSRTVINNIIKRL